MGIFYNAPLCSRLQQVPDLSGFFPADFFPSFFVSSIACVNTIHFGKDFCKCGLWDAAGRRRCAARLERSVSPLHMPAVNTDEYSVLAACRWWMKDNMEIRKWIIFLTSSNIKGKESRFSDERAPFRVAHLGCCSASSLTGYFSPMKTFPTCISHLSTLTPLCFFPSCFKYYAGSKERGWRDSRSLCWWLVYS